jgi:hypothetical protein
VDQVSDSMLSPVLAPRVARMVPFVRERRWIRPSWLPTATTAFVGFMAREVRGPASKRASNNPKVSHQNHHNQRTPGGGVGIDRFVPSPVIFQATVPD